MYVYVCVQRAGTGYRKVTLEDMFLCMCVCAPLFDRTEDEEGLPIPSGPVYVSSNITHTEITLLQIHTYTHKLMKVRANTC